MRVRIRIKLSSDPKIFTRVGSGSSIGVLIHGHSHPGSANGFEGIEVDKFDVQHFVFVNRKKQEQIAHKTAPYMYVYL